MGVSKNSGTPKSSILIGFSIIFTIHFWGKTPIFGNTHISILCSTVQTVQYFQCCLLFPQSRPSVGPSATGHACLGLRLGKVYRPFHWTTVVGTQKFANVQVWNQLLSKRRFKSSLRRKISGKNICALCNLIGRWQWPSSLLMRHWMTFFYQLNERLIVQVGSSVEALGMFVACHLPMNDRKAMRLVDRSALGRLERLTNRQYSVFHSIPYTPT